VAAAEPRNAASAPAKFAPAVRAESDLVQLEVAEEPERPAGVAAPPSGMAIEAKAKSGERPAPALAPAPKPLLARTQAADLPLPSPIGTVRPRRQRSPIRGQTSAAAAAGPAAGGQAAPPAGPPLGAPATFAFTPPPPLLDLQSTPSSLSSEPATGGTATPPDVRITIGRVEVRAQIEARNEAPAIRRAERRRQQPVSLEDYLRHGAKGGR
jgi:hypothetical protein